MTARRAQSSAGCWVSWAPPHPEGLGDALEFECSDRFEPAWLGDAVGDGLADQHLPGRSPSGQPGGNVHCGSVDVAVLEHHRPTVDPSVGRGQALDERLGHHLGGRPHRSVGLAEHEHPPVAQPADRPAGIAAGDALHQRREPPGQLQVPGAVGPLLLGVAAWSMQRGVAAFSVLCGVVGSAASLLYFSQLYLGLGPGGMEHLAFDPLTVWTTVLGFVLLGRWLAARRATR
jgi:hypothetical protein